MNQQVHRASQPLFFSLPWINLSILTSFSLSYTQKLSSQHHVVLPKFEGIRSFQRCLLFTTGCNLSEFSREIIWSLPPHHLLVSGYQYGVNAVRNGEDLRMHLYGYVRVDVENLYETPVESSVLSSVFIRTNGEIQHPQRWRQTVFTDVTW